MPEKDNSSQKDVTDGCDRLERQTYHAECPGCEESTTFSKGAFGISCDSCSYTPRRRVREEIKGGDR